MKFSSVKQVKIYNSNSALAKKSLLSSVQMGMAAPSESIKKEFNANETYHEVKFSNDWEDLRTLKYKEYRQLWDSIPRKKIELEFPLHLDIETTNICNLQCPMCPRTIMLANETFSELGFMSKDDYKRIIDEASKNGVKSIKLNYLGEPLSHPDVVWHVQYAKEQGVIDVMMNSNASLLTKQLGIDLLNAGLDNLFVSFDAVDPKDYSSQRTGTTIGKVIDNLYNFTVEKKKIRPECQIRVSMVMYENIKWQEQFEALKVIWRNHVDAVGYGFYIDRDELSATSYPEVKGFHCAQPFQRMFLKYNGNVTICCVDDKDETVVGNWHNDSLTKIWRGKEYRDIRNKHANGKYYDIEMCRKCYLPVSP